MWWNEKNKKRNQNTKNNKQLTIQAQNNRTRLECIPISKTNKTNILRCQTNITDKNKAAALRKVKGKSKWLRATMKKWIKKNIKETMKLTWGN